MSAISTDDIGIFSFLHGLSDRRLGQLHSDLVFVLLEGGQGSTQFDFAPPRASMASRRIASCFHCPSVSGRSYRPGQQRGVAELRQLRTSGKAGVGSRSSVIFTLLTIL